MKVELVKRIVYDLIIDKERIATFDTLSTWNECIELMDDEEYGRIIIIPVPDNKLKKIIQFPIIKVEGKKYFLYQTDQLELTELLKKFNKDGDKDEEEEDERG